MSITSKLEYLEGTKDYIRQCIQEKGVSVPASTTFREYGDKILLIETGSTEPPDVPTPELNLQEKTANPTGTQFDVTPDEDYNGLSKVTVTGEVNLKPENIAYGVTIYGITGTMETKPLVGGLIPTAYQGYFDIARQLYPGDYKNLMILESDQAVAFGFMLNGFNVESYDEETTEFTASKWVYVAYNKRTNQWKLEDWSGSTSNGNSYIKNIRYSDTYIYYGTTVIYPYIINPSPELEITDFEFVVTINSSDVGENLLFAHSGSGVINYGDGTGDIELPYRAYAETGYNSTYVQKVYESAGDYTVHISGNITRFFGSISSSDFLLQRISEVKTPLPSSVINAEGLFARNLYLKTVPENLFEYSKNLYNLENLFARSVISTIPPSLFFNAGRLKNIKSMFNMCKSLTSLPLGLFINNPLLNDVSSFSTQSNLTAIPNEIFANAPNIADADHAFSNFKGVSLPEKIFSTGISGIKLSSLFYSPSVLLEIPSDFLNEVSSPTAINSMFYNAKTVTSELPRFWERDSFAAVTHNNCFYGCSMAANYSDVPTGWK